MNTSTLDRGDLIQCDVNGRKFEAVYEGLTERTKDGRGLVPRHRVLPVSPHITWRTVTARQILERLEKQGVAG